ncbi:junctional sarcoplasmic reticulum protein 1-like [Salvia splendens]|uniref:junctional sarcoplasmic reticulum protein 1-like n=1 Tax=Salvia splendens TaxID=180675 RepID=UPI001C2525C4|nr:junctional sarcoplasmic reticulum protein 1-like [Salvia splendens]
MLIKEIPSTGTNGGKRETSSLVHKEKTNPSMPTTAPPKTSTTTPSPEVDEETLRHLDKILKSIPRELDDAAAFAKLKARLGISRSKAKASSSKTTILPSSPTSPPPSPIQPSPPSPTQSMQCSESTSDVEGLREDYGQPFAIPSPTNGDGSIPIHEPHLTKDGNINDEGVEEFLPLFDYGETDKKEKEPLRLRRLVDEEEPQIQDSGEEKEAAAGNLVREERKRKGKGNVVPTPKRSRPANSGVVITDASTPAPPLPGDEDSASEEQQLR